MTLENLKKKQEEMLVEKEKAIGNLNAIIGALKMLSDLIAEEEKTGTKKEPIEKA